MTKKICISMSEEMYASLKSYCNARSYTISQYVVQSAMERMMTEKKISCIDSLVGCLSKTNITDDDRRMMRETMEYIGALK